MLDSSTGLHSGFRVGTVNGDPHCLRERLLAALSADATEPLALDLISPTPHSHGVPSLGDAIARTPLAPTGFLE